MACVGQPTSSRFAFTCCSREPLLICTNNQSEGVVSRVENVNSSRATYCGSAAVTFPLWLVREVARLQIVTSVYEKGIASGLLGAMFISWFFALVVCLAFTKTWLMLPMLILVITNGTAAIWTQNNIPQWIIAEALTARTTIYSVTRTNTSIQTSHPPEAITTITEAK